MTDQQEQKPGEYLIGLTLGTAVAAGAWFLYKTKKGKKLRSWWEKYFNQIQDEWVKLQKQATEPTKKALPRPRRKPVIKKHTFHHSGQPIK